MPTEILTAWRDRPDALAALGLEGDTPDDRASSLATAAARRLVTLRYGPPPPFAAQLADDLEKAWRAGSEHLVRGPLGEGIRVRVFAAEAAETGADIAAALQSASGVQSTFLADPSMNGHGTFHWPLRVGFGPGATLAAEVAGYPHGHLLEVRGEAGPRNPVDLLIVERGELAQVEPHAAMVLVVATDVEEELRVQGPASLVAQVAGLGDPMSFVRQLFDNISHNWTPDRAIAAAAVPQGAYFVRAHPGYVERARVTAWAGRMRAELESRRAAGQVPLDRFQQAMVPLERLARIGDDAYHSEEGGGTDAIRAGEASREAAPGRRPRIAQPTTPEPAPTGRHLQAQVFARTPGLTQRLHSFEPGGSHRIDVRVGPSSLDWVSVATEFPPIHTPDDQEEHVLQVVLHSPALDPSYSEKEIRLGPTRESTTAQFDATVRPGVGEVHATLIASRGTTHLQTAALTGPVAAADQQVGERKIEFTTGDPSGADLDLREDPDLSLVVAGDAVLVRPKRGQKRTVELPGLADAMSPLRATLFDVAQRLEGLRQPLSSDNGTALVRTLALQGEFLKQRLFGSTPPSAATVEVVSGSSGEFLPVEFIYEHRKPERDAALCGEFLGASGPGCPNCQAAGSSKFVCPSGFWALSKSIERQIRTVSSGPDCVPPEPDTAEHVLPPTREVIFASSNNVNTASDRQRVQRTVDELGGLAEAVHVAPRWAEWRRFVRDRHPALLVALPHNIVGAAGMEALQIGPEDGGDELGINDIEPAYVGPTDRRPGPVMLLLGCNTANPAVGYQDFVRQMRCCGAAVVVSTLTYVLGQQAAPFATELVAALFANQGKRTFGEIMQDVRAKMLREDNPMALAVTAYGSAEWRFTTED